MIRIKEQKKRRVTVKKESLVFSKIAILILIAIFIFFIGKDFCGKEECFWC